MIKLFVRLTTPQGKKIVVGELVVTPPDHRGGLAGQFRYSGNYLEWESSFSLDPVNLPLSRDVFDANRPSSGVHGVFEDILPDDWGRRILIKRHNLNREKQRVPYLLQYLGVGLGALSYSSTEAFPEHEIDFEISLLDKLIHQAERYELNASLGNEELSLLLQAGSSPGGARPKVLVRDDNSAYIAKFPSVKDDLDVVALEAATMELARRCGIETAQTSVLRFGNTKALMVERFDITQYPDGRNHMISMQTLLNADGYYNLSYRNMAGIIRKVSGSPAQDLKRLYRQLIFNLCIGNTDDHLKNFCMLHGEYGWRLSPAFDLVPNIGRNQEHVLRIGTDNTIRSRSILMDEAKYFGIKQSSTAERFIADTVATVKEWGTVFASYNVPHQDIEILRSDIEKRLAILSD